MHVEEMMMRIEQDGRALDDHILLVDAFLNHQVDMSLMQRAGEAFARRFQAEGITRVVTVESSGIAPAGMAALCLGVPLVVFKKRASRITSDSVYQSTVQSFTKNVTYEMSAAKAYLPKGERILFIDDFLAMGEAALGALHILEEAECQVAGIGIVIEKTFQPGRKRLEKLGHQVYSLARIASMSPAGIVFAKEEA